MKHKRHKIVQMCIIPGKLGNLKQKVVLQNKKPKIVVTTFLRIYGVFLTKLERLYLCLFWLAVGNIPYVCVYIYIYIYIYIYMHTHIHICFIYIYIYTYIYIYMYYIYLCIYVCVCMYIYICIHTYIYIYIG